MANPGHPYRGIENDNPGNIKNIPGGWLGQIGTDAANHAIFSNPVYGARAMSYQLRRNVNVYKTSNLTQLIGGNSNYPGWAPASDGNNVQGYVDYITAHMNEKGYNITGESDITSLMQDSQFRQDLMKAMTELEGDVDYGYFTEEILKAGDEAVGKNEQDIDTTPSPSSNASQNPSNSPTSSPNATPGGNSSAGSGGTAATGGGELGFKDPTGTYPRQEYVNEQELNKSARAGSPEWETRLNLPKTAVGRNLLPKSYNPEYPSNKVNETPEGHRVELDDTVGEPRIEYSHMNGSGFSIEGEPDNARMLVNSYGDMVELVGNDFTMKVNGNGDVLYVGNLNFTVEGNMNLTVKKDLSVTVTGNYNENISKDRKTIISGDKLEYISGSYDLTVLKDYLVDVSDDYEIIANFLNINSKNGGEMTSSSGGSFGISADNVRISADDFTSTSSTISVGAASGQIGGNAVTGAFGSFGQFNSAAAVTNKLTNSDKGKVKNIREQSGAINDGAGVNRTEIKTADKFSVGGGQLA